MTILDVFKGKIKVKLVFDPPNPRKTSTHVPMVFLCGFSRLYMIISGSDLEKQVKIMIFDFYGVLQVPQVDHPCKLTGSLTCTLNFIHVRQNIA